MARFDVYRLRRRTGEPRESGYLVVDVQSPHLDFLESRVVVPLWPRQTGAQMAELTPVVTVDEDTYIVMTPALASIGLRGLGHPIGSLIAYRDQIARALDILITGF